MRHFATRAALLLGLTLLLAVGWAVAEGPLFHGNTKTHIFHRQGCRYFDCQACQATFVSREAAMAAGYRPCKVCKP